jgi:transmembrane sensor
MQEQAQNIMEVYQRWLNGEASPADEQQLKLLLKNNDKNELLSPVMRVLFEESEDDNSFSREQRQQLAKNIIKKYPVATEPGNIRAHRIHFLKTAWFRYAAAIIILFGMGAYLWNAQNHSNTITQTESRPLKNDVLPGGQRAILKLADGREIILDSAANGQLATENGSEVIKKDGQIVYGASRLINTAITYNTMSTPKGGQYQLTLIDGTKVWLNAASSITYPTVFNQNTREVKITGEAYLEVAKNKSKPFIVKTSSHEVTVLGTSFNINNYSDEPNSKISLVNGSVKVNEKLLRPGQAFINGKIIATNIEQDVAWKNGVFDFNNLNAEQAMRQLARWYGVDIKFEGNINGVKFGGELDRSLTLSDVLGGLEGIAGLHFTLKENIIIVRR